MPAGEAIFVVFMRRVSRKEVGIGAIGILEREVCFGGIYDSTSRV